MAERRLLDPHCPPGCARLTIEQSALLGSLDVTPSGRPQSVAALLGYVHKVGARRAALKVIERARARPSERLVALVALGSIKDAPGRPELIDRPVLAVGLRTPPQASQLVTSLQLITTIDDLDLEDTISKEKEHELGREALGELAGWSPHSGDALNQERCRAVMAWAVALWRAGALHESAEVTPRRWPAAARWSAPLKPSDDRPEVVLFGYGHYARTCLMPTLREQVALRRVHELDVTLIGALSAAERSRWSSSPWPVEDDHHAALWWIAGYHHHHAPLAIEAIEREVDLVVEKPLATREEDLDALLKAWRRRPETRLWQGFHRRSWQAASWLRQDLGLTGERAAVVDYHCVVHEVSLPEHHWYRWARSGSRLIMNGCHWVEEFLRLNAYREPVEWSAWQSEDGETVTARVLLEHGAVCSICLSASGSDRLGVRELTRISCGERSATIVDQTYLSEDHERVLRREKIQESRTYADMVRQITEAHRAGHPGERIDQVERLWRLIFALDRAARG